MLMPKWKYFSPYNGEIMGREIISPRIIACYVILNKRGETYSPMTLVRIDVGEGESEDKFRIGVWADAAYAFFTGFVSFEIAVSVAEYFRLGGVNSAVYEAEIYGTEGKNETVYGERMVVIRKAE